MGFCVFIEGARAASCGRPSASNMALKQVDLPGVLVESRATKRIAVVELPAYEQAKACYADPAYEEAKQYALKASNREILIFEGELD